MLKLMRKSFSRLKWILVFIVFLFVLFVFAQWGAGGGTGQSATEKGYVARVNGETITVSDYQRGMYYAEKNYENSFGQPLTPQMRQMLNLPQQVLNGLIDQKLMIQQARKLKLSASQEEVRNRILHIQALNPGGQFVGEEAYQQYVVSHYGFPNTAQFEETIADQVTLSKLESAMASSVVITPKAAEEEYRKQNENAKIHFVLLPVDRTLSEVKLGPAEAATYYKTHLAHYNHGPQRRIKYLLADLMKVRSQMKIDEATLRATYESQKETKFKMGESAHALHILIKPADQTPAADEAAKKKAEGLVAQLRAGADFAKLAKDNSADPGSAARGGDLGYFEKGQMVPSFNDAAFSLPIGQISDPVKSQFGYHIIKVLDRKAAGYRPFEQVRFQLEQQQVDERARDQAHSLMTTTASKIESEKLKSDADFRTLTNDVITYNDSGWIGTQEPIPGVGNDPTLKSWSEKAKLGDVGPVIDTPRGPMIPRLAETRDSGTFQLDEIRARVENDARREHARDLAKQQLAALAAGGVDGAAKTLGLVAADATVSHNGNVQGLTGDIQPLVAAALAGKVGDTSGPVAVDNGAVLFKVVEQNRFNPQTFATDQARIVDSLRQEESRKLRTALLAKLKKDSNVVTNDQLIEQLAGGDQNQKPS